MTLPVRVGVVGCGTISGAYLKNMTASPHLEIVACADQVYERAQARAIEFGVPHVCTTDELLASDDVELVVNLTVPLAHAEISVAALRAGKHVFTEKPFATTRDDGRRILDAAASSGLTVAGANRGPENWHPNPGFFFEPGGGPLLDIGPYYLTTLVCFLGPVRRVAGMARILYPTRTADRGPRAGETFNVSTPTFVAALIEFESGTQATLVNSFGIWGHDLPNMQLYCTKGILSVPDPNYFGGPVRIRPDEDESVWREVPLLYHHTEGPGNFRGLGVIEMARGLRRGEKPRASGELAYHVLDVMESIRESYATGRHIEVHSRFPPPSPLPLDDRLVLAT